MWIIYTNKTHCLSLSLSLSFSLSVSLSFSSTPSPHQHYGFDKSELEAKVWYLTCVKQFSLYGCTLFPIMHKGMWSHTSESLLAINMDGIKFVRLKDKYVIHDFKVCKWWIWLHKFYRLSVSLVKALYIPVKSFKCLFVKFCIQLWPSLFIITILVTINDVRNLLCLSISSIQR